MDRVWKTYGRAEGSRAPASRDVQRRDMRISGKMKHAVSGRGGARTAPERRGREGGRTDRGARDRHPGAAGLGRAAARRREILA
jgi:hypothetical protein